MYIIYHRKKLLDATRLAFLDLCDLEFIFEIPLNVPQLLLVVRYSFCGQFPHFAVEPKFHDKENPLFLTVSNQEEEVNAYHT